MEEILKQFECEHLYAGCSHLLSYLGVKHTQEVQDELVFAEYYEGEIPLYVQSALSLVKASYYVGEVCDESIAGNQEQTDLKADIEKLQADSHYKSMMLFAVDLKSNCDVSRTQLAVLTRAFNRLVLNFPVTVFFRQGKYLSLGTCERTEYQQEWRQGEKLGRVSILRDIDCSNPHRGHQDILKGLDCSDCVSFDKLYEKWTKVFNSELLTKRFYSDLFDWYQWAVSKDAKVSFPNNVNIQEDDREDIDTKVIRLITRLMFVWFIKQKGLIPERIFDEAYLRSILKDFDPLSADKGNYYNAILQNLFFGTLNRPILEDGEVRGFAESSEKDVTNKYRYAELFTISKENVINLFASVPYLNCGLFECLDKTKTLDGAYFRYDGFSRNDAQFKDGTYRYRATVPNILFFDPERGLLKIFEKYVFTIEENTPQDVQVALDPELLGKVFENLLGAYNPETQETARNQSGSFYTPREIVQYMVNESLIAHLKRTVGEELEPQFRQLLDYTTETISLTEQQRIDIIHSLFTCKILDPACGSGAFPMGMLQQMVHILRQVDPENKQWRNKMENLALEEAKHAFGIENEEERNQKLQEIKDTFNNNLNSPDYTRKLYIIESCIYGVDIQPIAMLITRLRFFITLICEQKDILRDKPEENFGIKTLPNLESKFVAANSLIDADIHKYNEDWTNNEELTMLKNELIAIRRRHFYTRKRSQKISLLKKDEALRHQIHTLINKLVGEPNKERIAEMERQIVDYEQLSTHYQAEDWVEEYVQQSLFDAPTPIRVDRNKRERDRINNAIKECRRVIDREYNKSVPTGFEAAVLQVTDWNPYDQNKTEEFLDIEWMFGVKDGFDILIANPPYISTKTIKDEDKIRYEGQFGFSDDTYNLFTFRGFELLKEGGSLIYITPKSFWTTQTKLSMRELLLSKEVKGIYDTANPFEAVMVDTCIFHVVNTPYDSLRDNMIAVMDGHEDLVHPIQFKPISQSTYINSLHSILFKPSDYNLKIWKTYADGLKSLYNQWWEAIETSKKIDQNKARLEVYRNSLKPGDVALLGCLTEGGQGLATANNGRFIAIKKSSRWSNNVLTSRPNKLEEAVRKSKIPSSMLDGLSPRDFLRSSSETEIALKFDLLKEKYGRDIFGQGYIYRLVEDKDIVDASTLSQEEKENGIASEKPHYVLYDKGDKEGNRWYLETPFVISWTKENVKFLKSNSGKKGQGMPVVRNPQFYFREGFCWSDINTTYLKCRLKSNSVYDVKSMSLFGVTEKVPEYYLVCLINSTFMSLYVDTFVNNTQTFQINDARQLPIVIPSKLQLSDLKVLFDEAVATQKEVFAGRKTKEEAAVILNDIQQKLDAYVLKIYLHD